MTLNYWAVSFIGRLRIVRFFKRLLTQMRLGSDLLGFGISLAEIDSRDSACGNARRTDDAFALIIRLPRASETMALGADPGRVLLRLTITGGYLVFHHGGRRRVIFPRS